LYNESHKREGKLKMRQMSYSDARASLKTVMDEVCADHAPLMVTRQSADPVVILSLDDYNSINETLHLLGSAHNAERLRRSIAQVRAGKAKTKELYQHEQEKGRAGGS
jgi:antitoxin YefM